MSSPADRLRARTPPITESSFKAYMANLTRINGNKEPTSVDFLEDVDAVLARIAPFALSTRKTYLAACVTVLANDPAHKALYDRYYALMLDLAKELSVRSAAKPDKTQGDVLRVLTTTGAEIDRFTSKKKPLTEAQYADLLSFVVLALFTMTPPRRNADYALMWVCRKMPLPMDTTKNYYCLKDHTFYFNAYKTAGTYKLQTMPVPQNLQDVIKKYLFFHPMKAEFRKAGGCVPLLVRYDKSQLLVNNAITHILNRVLKGNIGVSMLRHIYLTDKFGDGKTDHVAYDADLKSTATAMGTSPSTALNTYTSASDEA